jgi:membrane fusion protein (multidrug efflux system)
MIIMLIIIAGLFAIIFGFKLVKNFFVKRYMSAQLNPAVYVSAMKVDYSMWQPQIKASASLRAVFGVNVTTESAGMVRTIYFTPGSFVKEGTVLVQLNADTEIAQLHALQATAELAKITYLRDKAQLAAKAVSQQTVDSDLGNLQNTTAQVEAEAATVAKKTIQAPFTGRLGINYVNPGQFLNPGDKVTTLQTQDPIYVDFFVPQQALARLHTGQTTIVVSDSFHQQFTGKITTINPAVDTNTRNIEVEATIANPDYILTPGMFVSATVLTGDAKPFLTLPLTAISFNSYGDIVYILKASKGEKDKNGKPIYIAQQSFVTTGEKRGDQVEILQGIKKGDLIVTSGQLKLKNGSRVVINNSVVPENLPLPNIHIE